MNGIVKCDHGNANLVHITTVVDEAYDAAALEVLCSNTLSRAGKALWLGMAAVRKLSTLLMQLFMVTQAEQERHSTPFLLSGVSENVRDAFNSAGADKLVTCIREGNQ